jgi:HlyD family secretion protein
MKRRLVIPSIYLMMTVLSACDDSASLAPAVGTLERVRVNLSVETNEPIVEKLVREGDHVTAGESLLRQDPERPTLQLERAQAELRQAEAVFAEAVAGPRAETIAQARARVQAAETVVRTSRLDLDRSRSLLERQLISDSVVDVAQGSYDQALAVRQEAVDALEELIKGTRSEEIAQAQSSLEAAEASLAEYELALKRATLRAPVDGIIEALPYEQGERPTPGTTVVALLADGRIYARVFIPQPLRGRLQPGARAALAVDGYDGAFPGRLRWIAADASFTPFYALTRYDRGRLSYLAEIDLTGAGIENLPVGIAVEARFPDL